MIGAVGTRIARAAFAALATLSVVSGLVVTDAVSGEQPAANAAPAARAVSDLSFAPGNIISDALFWDANAMNVAEIQTFLNGKVPNCAAGYTCLKNYTETTRTIAATPMCAQYTGAANESAATIIYRVAQTCGISPKVLLVILQKEQGLVTHSSPSAGRLRAAMGAGCPDTAACDSNYYGFFNQVHYGAYLLKRYTQPAGTGPGTAYDTRYDLRYPVGKTSNILYNPNANCGTLGVYVENQATHALYIYTPYTPNAAALATSTGIGDGCSSYGNRNFFSFYTAWFGPTHGFPIGQYFRDYYTANSSWLGYTTGPMTCGGPDSGCIQPFDNGMIAGSYSTYAAGVPTEYALYWGWYGREYGELRYPISEYTCDSAGCRQQFQGGSIVTPAGGTTTVLLGSVPAWLGSPTQAKTCTLKNGACYQGFANGWVVQGPTGTFPLPTPVREAWGWYGRETNFMGFPTSGPSAEPTTGNYSQSFQGGTITVTGGSPALTAATDPVINATLTSPWLGAAIQAKSCSLKGGACYQAFANGWIVQGPTGVFALPTPVRQAWGWYGREYAFLGFPIGAPSADPNSGTYTQAFQGGSIAVTGGVPALAAVSDALTDKAAATPWLGASTQAKSCSLKGGACYQAFANGWMVQGPTGLFAMPTAVREAWGWYGREYNVLGFPTSDPSADPTTGTYTQTFQGGSITVSGGVQSVTVS